MHRAIRLAALPDLAGVEEIVQAAYEPWVAVVGGRPAPMDADYVGLIAAGRVHVVAPAAGTDPGELQGLIVLIPEDAALLVENVAVRPRSHGRGIGRALMDFAEAEARRLELPAVRLYTHVRMTRNLALYESIGYHETGRQAIPGGSLVHMSKQLR